MEEAQERPPAGGVANPAVTESLWKSERSVTCRNFPVHVFPAMTPDQQCQWVAMDLWWAIKSDMYHVRGDEERRKQRH